MCAGALAHRIAVDRHEFVPEGVAHGARGVIDRAGEHADVGEGHVVGHHVVARPFHLLEAPYAFKVEDVGPGAVHAGGFVHAVVIHEHVVTGAGLRDAVELFGDGLVVAVHEVDLEALDAHFRIGLAGFLQVFVEHVAYSPEHQVDFLGAGIAAKLLEVDGGAEFQDVELTRPAFVEHHILDLVGCGEVDVVFIGFGVDAGLEIDAGDVPVVPPVPGHLAGLDPRDVLDAARGGEQIDQIVLRQARVALGDGQRTPRETARLFLGGIGADDGQVVGI